jgi:hypothetical protein
MGLVPHSGNQCSGLCQAPCSHEGCWQCAEVSGGVAGFDVVADSYFDREVRRKVDDMLRATLQSQEEVARQKLKESGASDEDIAAAEMLLKWHPKEGEPVPFLTPRDEVERLTSVVNTQLISETEGLVNARLISKAEAMRRFG